MPFGPTLWVKVEATEEEVIFTIGDAGQGIPEDNAKNLFTPFYTTKSERTGLGLVTCKHIIEAHSGRIKYESIVGKGTDFVVALPLSPIILDYKEISNGPLQNLCI